MVGTGSGSRFSHGTLIGSAAQSWAGNMRATHNCSFLLDLSWITWFNDYIGSFLGVSQEHKGIICNMRQNGYWQTVETNLIQGQCYFKSPRCVKKNTHDKSILSCCWEICKAICMYGMNKSSRSPPKLCILCFEKLQVKSNTMDVSLTSEIWSWIIPWVFSHSLGWNYTFHSIF